MAEGSPILENFSFCIGFLQVIIGRLRRFTKNTIIVVLLLLARFNLIRLWIVAGLWVAAFFVDMMGTLFTAMITYYAGTVHPERIAINLEV